MIAEVLAMMRPSIPSSIQLRSHIHDDLPIRMDAGELHQMLVNLVINARDAIDGQGVIDIHLRRAAVSGAVCAVSHERLSATYLVVEVADNGSGIAAEHLARLFDPFFTTKEVGKGTGLGLSMLHGILRRAGGHVAGRLRAGPRQPVPAAVSDCRAGAGRSGCAAPGDDASRRRPVDLGGRRRTGGGTLGRRTA